MCCLPTTATTAVAPTNSPVSVPASSLSVLRKEDRRASQINVELLVCIEHVDSRVPLLLVAMGWGGDCKDTGEDGNEMELLMPHMSEFVKCRCRLSEQYCATSSPPCPSKTEKKAKSSENPAKMAMQTWT